MFEHFETFTSTNGHKLFLQNWKPKGKSKGNFWFTHGFAEHSSWHSQWLSDLAKEGWNVWAWDLPGHGLSSGIRGDTGCFETSLETLNTLINENVDSGPLFVGGHSLGGLITYLYLEHRKFLNPCKDLSGAVLIAPAFKPMLHLPSAEMIVNVLSTIAPNFRLPAIIPAKNISSLKEVQEDILKDAMRGKGISFFTLDQMVTSGKLTEGRAKVKVPLLTLLSEKDKVVSSSYASKFLKKQASKNTVKKLKCEHDLFHDRFKDEALKEVRLFLKKNAKLK